MPTTLLDPELEERTWWKKNPEPEYTPRPIVVGADRLVLWNYPVGKADLADVHARALRLYLQTLPLTLGAEAGLTKSVVSIIGHASNTGEASLNNEIARDRAEVVAAYLRGLGFKDENLDVSSLGSSHPWFPSQTGPMLARNRRVEVTQYIPKIEPPPRERIDPSEPTGTPPQKSPEPWGGGTYYVEGQFDFELPDVEDATLSAKFAIVVKFKGKVSGGKNPQAAAGLVFSGGKIGGEFKAKVREKLDVKLGLEPGKTGHPPVLKASVEGEAWGFPVEIGLETDRHFLVMEVALPTSPLPEIEINGSKVECEVEVTVKVAMGPSKVLLARIAAQAAAGGAVTTGLVAGGVLTVTAVIIGGTIYAGERAKQQMADLVVEMAVRDGAASRVSYEALGATKDVQVMYERHKLDLKNAGGEPSREGFERGQKIVGDYLDGLKDKKEATIKAWAETYGKGKNAQDFDKLREQFLYERFDAYKNDRKPIEQAIAEL
jgi:outer membrane protein OmpA-like peptidoglycan-associated protein